MGRQLVPLHGTRNHSSTCRGGGARAPGLNRSREELVRGGDSSCEAETPRARQRLFGGIPLVGNWSKMLPTGRKYDVLPVWVLTGVLSPPRLESWPRHC
jgi:hypothetical protein